MLFGNREIDIIRCLQDLDYSEIFFPVESSEAVAILETIHSPENWCKWTDSSKKSDPPPDFYSDEYKMMIDVMRVNDTERKNNKGKLHNPALAREKELLKELSNRGIITRDTNVNIFIAGDTGLSTYEDHNYIFYHRNFSRVINKHIDSLPIYQNNHTDYKMVFIVYDESTAYVQLKNDVSPREQFYKNQQLLCSPHLFLYDKLFLDCFYNKGIDYLLWFAPYKLLQTKDEQLTLPRLVVFDLSKDQPKSIVYDSDKMASSEV